MEFKDLANFLNGVQTENLFLKKIQKEVESYKKNGKETGTVMAVHLNGSSQDDYIKVSSTHVRRLCELF